MKNYIQHIAKNVNDIQKILGVTQEEFSEMTNIPVETLHKIETEPKRITKAIAMKIFVVVNASAKYEKDNRIKALLAISFDLEQLDTYEFIERINKAHTA